MTAAAAAAAAAEYKQNKNVSPITNLCMSRNQS